MAELCLVHCFGKAEEAEGHDHQAGVEVMESLLGGAREAARAACGEAYREAPLLAEEYLARAIVSLAALGVRQGEAAALPGQRAEMVMLVLSAFFGAEEAGRAWRGFLAASVPVDV